MPNDFDTTQQSITQEIYKRNRELLKERRHAEELLYNVSEGIFAVDKEFTITIFDNALENMLGLPDSSAIGKKIDQVIFIETEKGEKIDLKQYCFIPPQKMPVLYDVVLKGTAKNYYVNVKFSVIESESDPNSSECLITLTDITKEIMLDKAKDDFISLASHELKTPLTIIKGYLWMVQSKSMGELNDEQVRYLDVAFNSTEQMISMVDDMLNISRMEQGRLSFNIKPGKIIKIIRDLLSPFDLQVQEKKIYLKLDLINCDDELDAYYDEGKFKECIINLVGNAVKFTKEGGVTVKVENTPENIKISVIDTGVGIAEEEIPKLYSKFGKGETSYKKIAKTGGTGLGLYIVKIFVEAMGGHVGYSSPGDFKGSIFWFTIPNHTILHN
ncbi:PAS domain-containing sensor histidine kinase [candidate division WWE3 bacterium]|nr:PAS domain-containing sensor histidine kinase [candidate division WWE3 bacterium]